MEPNESREQSGKPKENLVDSELTPLPSAMKDLPTVIVDPSLKVEAGQVEEKKRGRRRSKRPRGQLSQQKSDNGARPSDGLSAVEAERFANSIRPSWEPAAPAPESVDEVRVGVSIEHAADSLDETRVSHPEIAPAGTPIKIPYHTFSKQHIVWAGGAVVAVGVLLTLIVSTSMSGSSVAEVAKKRPSKQASSAVPQSAQNRKPDKQAIARNDLPRTLPKEAVVSPKPPQAQPSSPAQTASAPSVPIVQEAPKTVPVVESKVRIRVETSPKDAQLFLDGAPVGTPYDSRVALSGKHQFEARLDGFQSAVRMVDFNQDRLVYLSLSKVPVQAVNKATPRRQVAQNTSLKAVKRPVKQTAVKSKSPVRTRGASPAKSLGAGFVSTNPY